MDFKILLSSVQVISMLFFGNIDAVLWNCLEEGDLACEYSLKMVGPDLCFILIIWFNGTILPPQSGDRISLFCPLMDIPEDICRVSNSSHSNVLFINGNYLV